jgi:hypothetical protein
MGLLDSSAGRVGLGIATGGQSEVARAAMGLLSGGNGGGAGLEVLETPEQKAAREMLMQFASTGKFGNFTAGEAVPLGYGDFNATGYEQQGLTELQDLLRNGIPEQYRVSDEAIRGLMDTSEAGLDKQFQPYKALAERSIREGNAAVKRGAGFAGNLYSTDTIRNLGDVQARGNETMSAELARLSEGALNRKLSATGLAMQSAQAKEAAALSRVAASQEYGSLTRRLNDASIQARDAELLRRREELKLPITAATSVAGTPANFGVKSVETSPYQELLQMVGQIGGQYLGSYAGARGAAAGRAAA